MGYRDYSQGKEGLSPLTRQFNIMSIIGNGADIQILQHYHKISTTYENFYHFAKMRQQCEDNIILEEIEQQKSIGEGNWSDVENPHITPKVTMFGWAWERRLLTLREKKLTELCKPLQTRDNTISNDRNHVRYTVTVGYGEPV